MKRAALFFLFAMGCGSDEVVVTDLPPAGAQACDEQCVPLAPADWSLPALVWTGEPGEAPECPERAPVLGFEGGGSLEAAPADCPVCSCGEPAVVCEPPRTWTAESKQACPEAGPGVEITSFDAPEGWDGACTAEGAIAANAQCGTGACVRSLAIGLPVLTGACSPENDTPAPLPEARFETLVRACLGQPGNVRCASPGEMCAPDAPEGFSTCILAVGDHECPSEWPQKTVYFEGIDDARGCAPCTCSEPNGGACAALASVFTDGACSAIAAATTVTSAAGPGCILLPSGTALGSKSAVVTAIEPGACQPGGGEPTGSAEPAGPMTFCCLP